MYHPHLLRNDGKAPLRYHRNVPALNTLNADLQHLADGTSAKHVKCVHLNKPEYNLHPCF